MKTMYSCGPTVYARAHIGNLRAMAHADSERRKLEESGEIVKHVMNITDIDDKIFKAVGLENEVFDKRKHISIIREYTEPIIQQFKADLVEIGVDISKITFVNATDYLDQMFAYCKHLINTDMAYETENSIVLNTSKIFNYKSQGVDADFALWKLDKNRPGWHLECAVMSRSCLGAGFDLHTGGIDLRFPHHYNENAQSIAYDNKELCNYYSYCEHLLIDGQKMSKSLNNQYTLEDLKSRGYIGKDLRALFDKYQYYNVLDFTWDKLEECKTKIINIDNLILDINNLRNDLRTSKNFLLSDNIRNILTKNNVNVNDR